MTEKHTPGPWTAEPAHRQGFTVCEKTGFIVASTDEEGRYGAIESEANARLIAAAPDLLAALERQVANVKQWLDGGPAAGPDESLAIYEQMSAAIAKATGENA